MKNKKIFIEIFFSIVLVIFICIIAKNKIKENKVIEKEETEISYNSLTEMYEMKNKEGDVLHTGKSEEELYIYQIDPDYDAKITEN